jgi:hypothetical protein
MSFYKNIKWDNVPIDTLLEIIPIPADVKPYVSPIPLSVQYKIFDLLGIDIKECDTHNVMLVHLPPNSRFGIHSDKPVKTRDAGKLEQAVFLPLTSCQNVVWSWYGVTRPSKIYHFGEEKDWQVVPFVPDDAAIELENTKCDRPFITDIGTWHRLTNTGSESEFGISIRLMPWGWQPFKDCVELPPIPNLSLL